MTHIVPFAASSHPMNETTYMTYDTDRYLGPILLCSGRHMENLAATIVCAALHYSLKPSTRWAER